MKMKVNEKISFSDNDKENNLLTPIMNSYFIKKVIVAISSKSLSSR